MKDKKNALNGKDYINIGIFTAIYMVIVIAIACTVGLIPIGFILLPIIIPIIGGIPMMMYFTKIKKIGMILIFEILFGIVMILTGMGCDLLIWGIVVGIIGELILRVSRYSSGKMAILCYGVLSTCICGNYIHWISASEEWLTEQTATYGDTYVYTIHGILTIVSTTVSEFVAAMDRMHVTKKISMPISVLFRFFPTIVEEYGHVRDAMMMRDVGSIRNPMKMLEYRMVPFLTSIVSIGNDLSASALTRGLNAPIHRTNVCPIGFTWRDAIAIFVTICCLIIFIIFR